MGKPWGRLYAGMRNHRKIVALSRRHPTHWRVIYTLLEMSFETWDHGRILAAPGIPYSLAELAEEVRLSTKKLLPILRTMDELSLVKFKTECANSDLQNAKKTTIFLHFESWNRRQFESDLSTNRTQKHRAKSKESGSYDPSGTAAERPPERPGNGHRNVPETETETETEKNPLTPFKGGIGESGLEKSKKRSKRKADRVSPAYSLEFENFWRRYPNQRGGKEKAWEIWLRRTKNGTLPPAPELMDALERLIGDPDWMKEEARFVPHATTFLNAGRWTDADALQGQAPPQNRPDPGCPHCHGRGFVDAEMDGIQGQADCGCRGGNHAP